MNTNLKEISNFIKKNNSYSDFNLVDNFLLNLNFTKINFNKKLTGGTTQQPQQIEQIGQIKQIKQIEQIKQIGQIEQISNENLKVPPHAIEQNETYTIKQGVILYHATTNKKGFNTTQLNLGQDKLINFFTPNFRLASDKIEGCSVDKQNGFIHVFRVIKDIPNIYVRLPYDIANDISSGTLADEFCLNQKYSGVGFFYPKNNIELFSNNLSQFQTQYQEPYQNNAQYQNQVQLSTLDDQNQYYSEFGLCNPKPHLEYLYSQKCQSLRKLSNPYRFD
jgi:hypothetical protein